MPINETHFKILVWLKLFIKLNVDPKNKNIHGYLRRMAHYPLPIRSSWNSVVTFCICVIEWSIKQKFAIYH